MKYLFVGAHTDDIELCCGGTVAKLVQAGHNVTCLVFSHLQRDDLQIECETSLKGLGVDKVYLEHFESRTLHEHRQEVCQILIDRAKGMDVVYTHSKFDVHPDHATIGFESERALKTVSLLTYLAQWNDPTEYSYEALDQTHAEKKVEACAQYASQQHRPYMNRDYLYSDMRVAGIRCGPVLAEKFRVVRLINK